MSAFRLITSLAVASAVAGGVIAAFTIQSQKLKPGEGTEDSESKRHFYLAEVQTRQNRRYQTCYKAAPLLLFSFELRMYIRNSKPQEVRNGRMAS